VFLTGITARHIIPKQGFLVKPIDCGLGAVAGLFFEVKLTIISPRKPKRLAALQKFIRFSFENVNIILFWNLGTVRLIACICATCKPIDDPIDGTYRESYN
jgi:hypothetical protein